MSRRSVDRSMWLLASLFITGVVLDGQALAAAQASGVDRDEEKRERREEGSDSTAAARGWLGMQLCMVRSDDLPGAMPTLQVGAVLPASPAERAGVRENDQLVAIDGRNVEGLTSSEVAFGLLGNLKHGQSVKLRLLREGRERELVVEAERAPSDGEAAGLSGSPGPADDEGRPGEGPPGEGR